MHASAVRKPDARSTKAVPPASCRFMRPPHTAKRGLSSLSPHLRRVRGCSNVPASREPSPTLPTGGSRKGRGMPAGYMAYLILSVAADVLAVAVLFYWIASRKRIAAETVGRAEEQARSMIRDAERECRNPQEGIAARGQGEGARADHGGRAARPGPPAAGGAPRAGAHQEGREAHRALGRRRAAREGAAVARADDPASATARPPPPPRATSSCSPTSSRSCSASPA